MRKIYSLFGWEDGGKMIKSNMGKRMKNQERLKKTAILWILQTKTMKSCIMTQTNRFDINLSNNLKYDNIIQKEIDILKLDKLDQYSLNFQI